MADIHNLDGQISQQTAGQTAQADHAPGQAAAFQTAQPDPAAQATGSARPDDMSASGGGAVPGAAAAVVVPWYRSAPFLASVFLLIAVALAAAALVYQKYTREQALTGARQAELAALKAQNDQTEAYVEQLRRVLDLDPCAVAPALSTIAPPPGAQLPFLNATPAPAHTPAAPNVPAQPGRAPNTQTPGVQPDQNNAAVPPAPSDQPQKAAEPRAVSQLLEQATVLILAGKNTISSMGSGFFITPTLIVTNAHVIKDCSTALITNKSLGFVQSANIALVNDDNGLDLAVLQVPRACPVTPLKLATSPCSRTDKVSAWGFPGTITTSDPKFQELTHGNTATCPEVVYSEGTVNVILEYNPPVIVHSAEVSHGNSGGPLVNANGEVVGINTAIKLDEKTYRQSSFAIPSATIIEFLKGSGVPYTPAQ